MSRQKFLYEYFDGSVLVKVWEVTGYRGEKFTARTIHPYRPSKAITNTLTS